MSCGICSRQPYSYLGLESYALYIQYNSAGRGLIGGGGLFLCGWKFGHILACCLLNAVFVAGVESSRVFSVGLSSGTYRIVHTNCLEPRNCCSIVWRPISTLVFETLFESWGPSLPLPAPQTPARVMPAAPAGATPIKRGLAGENTGIPPLPRKCLEARLAPGSGPFGCGPALNRSTIPPHFHP